jgi:dTDP-4-amino-4,6-dideoxygalactose transaminase
MIQLAKPTADDADIQAVVEVLRAGQWASGPVVGAFEQEFAATVGVKHGVAVSNGTVAIHAALLAAGVGRGDLVLTTPFTFIATTNSIMHAGARPVFADVDEDTFVIDPESVRQLVRKMRVKAILIVHIFGQSCDMDAICDIANEAGIPVIEDCAQAHGAEWRGRSVGTFGFGATYSFYATKNLACGEGGMFTTNDDSAADYVRSLINHGRSGQYDHALVGYNYRMSSLHAALGRTQLQKLPAGNRRRREIANRYRQEIRPAFIQHPKSDERATHVYHQYTIRVASRDRLQAHLRRLEVASNVVYPRLSYQQPAYSDCDTDQLSCPKAEKIVSEVLSIPVHAALTDAEVARVIEACNSFSP